MFKRVFKVAIIKLIQAPIRKQNVVGHAWSNKQFTPSQHFCFATLVPDCMEIPLGDPLADWDTKREVGVTGRFGPQMATAADD